MSATYPIGNLREYLIRPPEFPGAESRSSRKTGIGGIIKVAFRALDRHWTSKPPARASKLSRPYQVLRSPLSLQYNSGTVRRGDSAPRGGIQHVAEKGNSLAKFVGPEGGVYAFDSDEKAIRAVDIKAAKRGYHNIKTYASSASDLSFIKDASVDFILASGLLCSMAAPSHEAAVNEMKRILKPGGLAYLSVAKGSYSYVNRAEWEKILSGFRVERRGNGFPLKPL